MFILLAFVLASSVSATLYPPKPGLVELNCSVSGVKTMRVNFWWEVHGLDSKPYRRGMVEAQWGDDPHLSWGRNPQGRSEAQWVGDPSRVVYTLEVEEQANSNYRLFTRKGDFNLILKLNYSTGVYSGEVNMNANFGPPMHYAGPISCKH